MIWLVLEINGIPHHLIPPLQTRTSYETLSIMNKLEKLTVKKVVLCQTVALINHKNTKSPSRKLIHELKDQPTILLYWIFL
ncbi:hypothetical protein QE152_g1258 [Popillia japonica]|uniref:Uncharacterized protein n=1 Tax=Popillia japonica TaxID=7064 RepID=A0AAW1NBM4_POPJA